MTVEISFLYALLVGMVYLFVTEKLPVELTAFTGLLILVAGGYVGTDEAFSGFSSPAVITMFSIFFISTGLRQTGVAEVVGRRISGLARGSEARLIVLIMLSAAALSAFMFNVAAVAVMMPAVAAMARHAGLSPSRLFMPLAFGAILGGTTTVVGTPPNILMAEEIDAAGLAVPGLFGFAPIGLVLLGVGVVYMVTWGRRKSVDRLLPASSDDQNRLARTYSLQERMTTIQVPKSSRLDGRSIGDSKLGTALDVQVLAHRRGRRQILAPGKDVELQGEDKLLVDGSAEDLVHRLSMQGIVVEQLPSEQLDEIVKEVGGALVRLPKGSGLIGRTLRQLHFRDRFGLQVVGIRRGRRVIRQHLARCHLRSDDGILVLGPVRLLDELDSQSGLVIADRLSLRGALGERCFVLRIPPSSQLSGVDLRQSRLGELAGVTVVGKARGRTLRLGISEHETLGPEDRLLISGDPDKLRDLLDVGEFHVVGQEPEAEIESPDVRLAEAVVAPRSSVAGSSLRNLHFRDRYGLQVLSVGRNGGVLRRDLAEIELRFGDSLLLQGPTERIDELTDDADFLLLTELEDHVPPRPGKAPAALAALALMVTLVVGGLAPIHLAAFVGAVAAVLLGALSMEEAYRSVEWRALFLVAAILPVGTAMQSSGAADLVAGGVAGLAAGHGPYVLLAATVVASSLLSQGLDGAPTVVIMSPIVVQAAEQLAISPYPLLVGVGLAASAGFVTPFSQKACLLVMAAGGYKTTDFVRIGTPLTLAALAILVVAVPMVFPF